MDLSILPTLRRTTSERAGYYVDSAYTGAGAPGAAVETAFFGELLPHIEATYRVHTERAGRAIGGCGRCLP